MVQGNKVARIGILIALLATLLSAAPAQAYHPGRLAETKREIAATRARLALAVRNDREILAALNEITGRLNHERLLLAAAQSKLTTIDMAMRAEQQRLDALDRKLASHRALMARRARTLYIIGPVDELEALTGATTIDQVVGRAGALESVASFDRRAIQDIRTIQYEAELTRRALASARKDAAEVRSEIAERVEVVAGYAAVKREAHEHAAGRVSSLRADLAAIQREQTRILGLIRSRGSVYTGGSGRLGFAWPIRGNINSPYGPRWGGYHTGIDIECRTGDGIGASKAGRVIEAGWGGGYGNMVIIDHGGGYASLYAHLSRVYVGVGRNISQHTKVGACGATGNATGDHLHFEIRVNGQHVNPRNYLP